MSFNILLNSLSASDAGLLLPHLRPIVLPQKLVLFDAGRQIQHVYFPLTGVISLVVPLLSGNAVEAAMVGRDGLVGASAALNSRTSLSRGVVQVAGHGLYCKPAALKSAVQCSGTHYVHDHQT